MRGFVFGIMASIVIALVGGYLVLKSGRVPANADGAPGGPELWAAGTALEATIRREAPTIANPVALTDANLVAGVRLYGQHCAFCHGTAAGNASASSVAKGEYPRPPQLGADGVEDDADGVTYWKIKHGIRLTGMPSWKDTLTDQQIWTVALFLKHMDKLTPAAQAEWSKVSNQ